jgi:signal transduction histidine kinase
MARTFVQGGASTGRAADSRGSMDAPAPATPAVVDVTAAALADERARTRSWLHDRVLQFLEFIAAGGWADQVDPEVLMRAAAMGAAELRAFVDGEAPRARHLRGALIEAVAGTQIFAGDVQITLTTGPLPREVAPEVTEALAGAVREALTNVCRHAAAHHARISCRHAGNEVHVEIADDGVGFDASAAHEGHGLRCSIVARLECVGGSARISSHPGHGTIVSLSAPVDGERPPRALREAA